MRGALFIPPFFMRSARKPALKRFHIYAAGYARLRRCVPSTQVEGFHQKNGSFAAGVCLKTHAQRARDCAFLAHN